MRDDAQTTYLFQCGDEGLFAVSPDRGGKNIPRTSCTQGWLLRQELRLGMRDPVPVAVCPESILRGITDKGYYIWRADGFAGYRDPSWPRRSRTVIGRPPSAPMT
jgi:hypothetical protein